MRFRDYPVADELPGRTEMKQPVGNRNTDRTVSGDSRYQPRFALHQHAFSGHVMLGENFGQLFAGGCKYGIALVTQQTTDRHRSKGKFDGFFGCRANASHWLQPFISAHIDICEAAAVQDFFEIFQIFKGKWARRPGNGRRDFDMISDDAHHFHHP